MGVVYLCLYYTNIQQQKMYIKKTSIYGLVNIYLSSHGNPSWVSGVRWSCEPLIRGPVLSDRKTRGKFSLKRKNICNQGPSFSSSILILGGWFLAGSKAAWLLVKAGVLEPVVSFQDSDGSVVSRRSLVNFQMAEVVKYQPPHTTANSSIEDLLVSNAMHIQWKFLGIHKRIHHFKDYFR